MQGIESRAKVLDLLKWLLERLPHVDICGLDRTTPLLTRYILALTPVGRLYIHHFQRSDEDRELHDHPWDSWSYMFAGEFVEETPGLVDMRRYLDEQSHSMAAAPWYTIMTRRRAGCVVHRPARWTHRVLVEEGKEAWTLIWCSKKRQSWGFYTNEGWVHHSKFIERRMAS